MASLKNLSTNQLNKMLSETHAELKRRENAKKAQKEIEAILQKYNLKLELLKV